MRKILGLGVLALFGIQANAQMDDVSVTLQPTASYNWFDSNTAIEDGVMVGGRVGFGFGEAIEIRGIYERSLDLKSTAEDITDNEDFINRFSDREVEVERIGGEFKANIPTRGAFVPYITLGTGVQKLKADITDETTQEVVEAKSDQIYANLGLGTMVSLGDRLKLSLEAKNTIFNMNPADVFFVEGSNPSDIEDILNDNREDRMYNWSVMAGLQLYLGGREPGKMSNLDRAYYNKFSGGLKGLKLAIEPGGAYINFNKDSNLRNTYLLGGSAGIDLNRYIGLRGFYYQSAENEEISTDWDKMAIYGGDIMAKLNVARGIQPYLTLGGGYMNVYDSYVGEDEVNGAGSGYFAKGGLGLIVPLSKTFEAYGAANLMYTTANDEVQDVVSPDELMKHTMYNVGLRIQLGKGGDNEDDILEDEINARVKERTEVYEDRIAALEDELQEAYENNDTEKAVEIIEEKKELEDKKAEIEKEETAKAKAEEAEKNVVTEEKTIEREVIVEKEASHIRMTPQELEDLVEKVIDGVDTEEKNAPATTDERIDRLERLLLEVNTTGNISNESPARQELANQRILDELRMLNTKVDNNAANINQMNTTGQGQDKTVIVTGTNGNAPASFGTTPNNNNNVRGTMVNDTTSKVVTDEEGNVKIEEEKSNDKGIATGLFVNEGMSLFGGFAFGEESSGLVGIRGHYSITNSIIEFMPDLYVAPGDKTGFGLNANAILTFDKLSRGVIVEPYVGLGVGYNKIGDFDKFGTNVLIGTSFNVLGGNLYADYTARGFVDEHQVAVGYKFGF